MNRYRVGIDDHYAWANLVTPGNLDSGDRLLDRRRVELLDHGLPASPYHGATIGMPIRDAEALVRTVRASAELHARSALASLIADLAPAICCGIAIRTPPLPRLPDSVAEIHADARIRNRADGMIYHQALTGAAEELGLDVCYFDKATVFVVAAAARGTSGQALEDRVRQLRNVYGPPWRKGHVVAYAGAIVAHVAGDP